MNKIAIVIISGLLISGVVFVLVTQRPEKSISPAAGVINNAPTTDALSQVQLKTYANASGFSFKYPESFILFEKEVTDESIYAWVELTNPKNKDVISIKLEDSNLAKIDDFFTTPNKKNGIKGEIKKVRLADLDGRQFTDKENQLVTLALDKGGVLVSISGNPSSVHQQIVSSFIFTQSVQTTTTSTSNDDVIFEGEEVVQ
ncbi:hypothetical protein HZA75_00590 [Candidatus Roizmanbacteria bacterium]|nr:hypothetical protein [Candidatus Roizmanbacteria bacterium]